MSVDVTAVLLAAGAGERMKSQKHKVLHDILGLPMIDYIRRAVQGAGVTQTVVVAGALAEQLQEHLADAPDVHIAMQDPAKGWGTAKAVMAAEAFLPDGPVFLLLGDSPLLQAQTLQKLLDEVRGGADAAVLTAMVEQPFGYGRMIRDERGDVCAIVEEKEATDAQRTIREINSSALCIKGSLLKKALAQVTNDNAKGEYYLTDVIKILYAQGRRVVGYCADATQGLGVNDRAQLAQVTRVMRSRINHEHMREGVTLIDPDRVDIGPDVQIGADSTIYPGCVLQGKTRIGAGCTLLPNCRLLDTLLDDEVTVESSVLLQTKIGRGSTVGPNAYLRPGTVAGENCRIGDFVEIKNATLGDGAHVSHLCYIGDADVGARVNIGCGVVFSNYDGKAKFRSSVGDDAFIGCNVNLISPVHVGEGAYIAAGTTITQDVPREAMAIGRAHASLHPDWVSKRKADGKL